MTKYTVTSVLTLLLTTAQPGVAVDVEVVQGHNNGLPCEEPTFQPSQRSFYARSVSDWMRGLAGRFTVQYILTKGTDDEKCALHDRIVSDFKSNPQNFEADLGYLVNWLSQTYTNEAEDNRDICLMFLVKLLHNRPGAYPIGIDLVDLSKDDLTEVKNKMLGLIETIEKMQNDAPDVTPFIEAFLLLILSKSDYTDAIKDLLKKMSDKTALKFWDAFADHKEIRTKLRAKIRDARVDKYSNIYWEPWFFDRDDHIDHEYINILLRINITYYKQWIIDTLHQLIKNTPWEHTLRLMCAIRPEFISSMMEVLQSHPQITNLDLNGTSIDDNNAQVLAEALKVNTTLKTLNLSRNFINEHTKQLLRDLQQTRAAEGYPITIFY